MGYDKSLFESQPVSEPFLCPICHDVLQYPHTADPCEHTFCFGCIEQCNQNSNVTVCPVCRVSINSSDIKPTMRSFCSIVGRLWIRCSFESCSEVVKLKYFEQHLLECAKNPDNKPKPCPNQCGANIVVVDYAEDEHNCVEFLQNQILSITIDKSQLELEMKKLTNEMEKKLQENQQLQTNNELLQQFLESYTRTTDL